MPSIADQALARRLPPRNPFIHNLYSRKSRKGPEIVPILASVMVHHSRHNTRRIIQDFLHFIVLSKGPGCIMPHDKTTTPLPDLCPKRIALCSAGELFGGVERHILGLLGGLRSIDIKVTLLLFRDGELAAQAREKGVTPIILTPRNRLIWATSKTLADILRKQQVQVAHVHGYKATVFCALARRWYRFAVVKTVHGLPEPLGGRPVRAVRERITT